MLYKLKVTNKLSSLFILVLIGLSNSAEAIKPLSLDWDNLTQEKYVNNLTSCEYKIQEFKWSKSLWPKENKKSKPSFGEVVNLESIAQKINNRLKMQWLLSDKFNIDITPAMLQHDLNRMANNTKDPDGLEELFQLFENNPQTIAQCVSLPYIIQKKTVNSFNWHNKIHSETKSLAETELGIYKKTQNADGLSVKPQTITFKLKGDEAVNELEKSLDGQLIIELDEQEFSQKADKLKQASLSETGYGFVYQELLTETADNIEVIILFWQKQPLHDWLAQQNYSSSFKLAKLNKLYLPEISDIQKSFGEKSITLDQWLLHGNKVPEARLNHTTIWTGTEMIVWGGSQNSGGYFLKTGGRYNPSTDSWLATSLVGAPSGRTNHSAIWSGTEMIIWGSDALSTGGRYNPSTDSWQTTSLNGAPSARYNHSAIWTGTEMIVWGGRYNANNLNTGARYNPSTDSWQTMNADGTPPTRYDHTAVWSGTEMIIWGGSPTTNTGGRYNPSTDSWQTINIDGAPSARYDHTAIWSGTEMIVWGGSPQTNTGGRYNPSTDNWQTTSLSGAPSVRYAHSAIWTGSEMIVWGGGNVYDSSGGRYNPSTDSWLQTSTNNAPSNRSKHTAIWTGTEMIIWGGANLSHSFQLFFNTGGRYNPSTDNWSATNTNNAPSARTRHTAIWTGTEMIVWGGASVDQFPYLNTGGQYYPITDNWLTTSTVGAPLARSVHTAIWSGKEMIVWGGTNGSPLNNGGRYNPITDNWMTTSLNGAPTARGAHTAVWSGSEMIVWGGGAPLSLNTGGRYNPYTDSWSETSLNGVPSARFLHTAIWTGSEMIVWGGNYIDNGNVYLNTGGRYNPFTDSWQSTPTNGTPSPRIDHAAIWSGTEMIVWGGYAGNNYYNTGGRYNPSSNSWEPTSIIGVTSKRVKSSAVWTGSEMVAWGGQFNSNLNTGGRYNPCTDSWVETTSNEAPSGRYDHTAIWDGRNMIVWGGMPLTNTPNIYSIETLSYQISGNIVGLNGNQLVLQNNGNDDLTLNSDGIFTFTTPLENFENYSVSILTEPTMPNQSCEVTGGTDDDGSGVINDADVCNIVVSCVTTQYDVIVSVTGLSDGTVSFSNGLDILDFSTDGTQTISTLDDGSAFNVDITAQPINPYQLCSFTNADSGNLNGSDVTIAVECVINEYDVNIELTGLAPGNSISFSNSTDILFMTENGTQTISTLEDGSAFDVNITSSQPVSPNQTCSFTSSDSGNLAGSDVLVTVECITDQYSIGGTLSGLDSGNNLVIQNNFVDDLQLSNDGEFIFNSSIDDLSQYSVSVLTNPTTPNQTCNVFQGSGTVNGDDVNNINITCSINTYFLGGQVTGLIGNNEMLLENNGTDFKLITSDGPYIFNNPLSDESNYDVNIYLQPSSPIQPCQVLNGTSSISGSDVVNIDVICEAGNDLIYRNGFN